MGQLVALKVSLKNISKWRCLGSREAAPLTWAASSSRVFFKPLVPEGGKAREGEEEEEAAERGSYKQ